MGACGIAALLRGCYGSTRRYSASHSRAGEATGYGGPLILIEDHWLRVRRLCRVAALLPARPVRTISSALLAGCECHVSDGDRDSAFTPV